MDAPQYLWDLLEHELHLSHLALLEKVAARFDIPLEELEREVMPHGIRLVPNKETPIVIKRSMRPKPDAPQEERCFARIWNRGKGGQCTRRRPEGCDFCSQHVHTRKHGDIREEVPRSIYPKKKKLLFV